MLNIQGFLAENCEQSFTAILFPKRFSLHFFTWEDGSRMLHFHSGSWASRE